MIHKLKMLILSVTSLFMFAAPLAVAGTTYAATNQTDINNGLCNGSNIDFTKANAAGNCDTSGGESASKLAQTVINVLSLIVGAVAVIMLIVGGFRYVTSGGKQESVTGAKNTILYALIGLVIVAVAQVVVHFVLNNVTGAVNGQ
jgi:hypothetical protein